MATHHYMAMQLIEVTNPTLERDFIQANVELNRSNPAYIRPIDKEINEVFDPGFNKAFRSGEIIRWVLKDTDDRLIGRIAAFVNKKYKNKGDDVPVGGVGFFDCINNQEAADMLLDVARHWLSQRGMEAMDGPINFGERDKWWGLLVEGFHEPLYGMNYNPPYYKDLLENYGFRPFFHQLCFGLDPMKPLSDKLLQRHAAIAADPAYSSHTIEEKAPGKVCGRFPGDLQRCFCRSWRDEANAEGTGHAAVQKNETAAGRVHRLVCLLQREADRHVCQHPRTESVFQTF